MEKHTNIENSISKNCNEEFLKEVYIQCNNIYLTFVNFRFQLLATFVSAAALFTFAYDNKENFFLNLMISIIGMIIPWIMFLIDRRNQYIVRRAIQKAKLIEIYFHVPEEMRIHSNSEYDLKNKISHTLIFTSVTICTTLFWIAYLVFYYYI